VQIADCSDIVIVPTCARNRPAGKETDARRTEQCEAVKAPPQVERGSLLASVGELCEARVPQLPKGTDLTAYDQAALDAIADELKHRSPDTPAGDLLDG